MKLVSNLMIMLFTVLMGIHMAANAVGDVVLVEPGPISLPTGKSFSLEEVRKAIMGGAIRNKWRIESDTPSTVRIILDGRKDHAVLVMDVVYDTKSYSVKYVSSEALRYVKGTGVDLAQNSNSFTGSYYRTPHPQTTIHSSYSRWMTALTEAINAELNIAMIK